MDTMENGLRQVNVPGVSSSYLYMAGRGSFFVPHVENCNLGSLSYQQSGYDKVWLPVASGDTAKFEKVMRDAVPEFLSPASHVLAQ